MIHEEVNLQFKIWHLIIAFCDYGVDYYWKDREGYIFTSNKVGILANAYSVVFSLSNGFTVTSKGSVIVFDLSYWLYIKEQRLMTLWTSISKGMRGPD